MFAWTRVAVSGRMVVEVLSLLADGSFDSFNQNKPRTFRRADLVEKAVYSVVRVQFEPGEPAGSHREAVMHRRRNEKPLHRVQALRGTLPRGATQKLPPALPHSHLDNVGTTVVGIQSLFRTGLPTSHLVLSQDSRRAPAVAADVLSDSPDVGTCQRIYS